MSQDGQQQHQQDNNSDRIHSATRRETERAREAAKEAEISARRFAGGHDDDRDGQLGSTSLRGLLSALESASFGDRRLLAELRRRLASGEERPQEVAEAPGLISGLVEVVLGGGDPTARLVAAQVAANLCPLPESSATRAARQAGPALVTALSSGSPRMREAAATALGNLALAGPRTVKVLLNQEALPTLLSGLRGGGEDSSSESSVRSSCLYALYHLLHSCHDSAEPQLLEEIVSVCRSGLDRRSPVELAWVLFVLSCNPRLHPGLMGTDGLPARAIDVLTYEIFQKSDSRPLVKIVTPLVRLLSNLCAGPIAESACSQVLRHPDLLAILVALLGTNYSHLAKETLHWFSNIVNCESMTVQEMLVDLDFLDKMEFHTVQAIQKLDPYMTNMIP